MPSGPGYLLFKAHLRSASWPDRVQSPLHRDAARQRPGPTAGDLRRLRLAADRGDADAQMNWVSCTLGTGRSSMSARRCLVSEGRAGRLREAQFNVGNAYASGERVARSRAGVPVVSQGCCAGLPAAEFAVGNAYAEGSGVWIDEVRAYEWYLKAAQQGNARAQLAVGEALALGRGVAQSDERSFPWLRQANKASPAQYLARDEASVRANRRRRCDGSGMVSEDSGAGLLPAQYARHALATSSLNSDESLLVPDETKTIANLRGG